MYFCCMKGFDLQTLYDLEFNQIKDWLVNYASNPTAKNRLTQLVPSNDFNALEIELQKLQEFKSIRTQGENFPSLQFEELDAEIRLLGIQNSVLSQEGFVRIFKASELCNALLVFFDKRSQDFPHLFQLLSPISFTNDLIEAIERIFTKTGHVRDDASEKLAEIRQQIVRLKHQINRNFDKEMRRYNKEGVLGETRETFLNERRVLTVLSSHKRKVSGMVLGSSKTGSLTFIEPAINIPLNNELELTYDDERKEIYRILQQLTKNIAHHLPLIEAYQVLLTELDFIQAKCKLALETDSNLPGIVRSTRIELIDAYHPILWKSNKLSKKPTIPQSVILDQNKRMLVISGPNAGGKSITLKTIGLLQLMLQAGLLIPVNENSKMCFFQQVLSDIGDNQSIENELSTYSYRLRRMKHFLKVSNKRTLLLLDEFGTGSDPDLGGALAEVFFEELYKKKVFAVVTTHYANIKLKATNLAEAENGSMLFDVETLEPLFKFSMGQPGSSFTFEVAQINGIPLHLIEAAKEKLDQNKVKMDKLLSDLTKEKKYLQRLTKEHIEAQEIAQKSSSLYLEKKQQFEQRLKAIQDQALKQNHLFSAGEKMLQFVEKYQLKSTQKKRNQELIDELVKYLHSEKSKIEAVRMKTEIAKKNQQKPQAKKRKTISKQEDNKQLSKIKLGSIVKLIETKQSGTIEELKGSNAVVSIGNMRVKVALEKLMWIR